MDSCLLLVLEPRAPGSLGVNNDDNYFHMYIHTRYFLSSFRDEIPILNFRSTSHIYIYVYNKAYYWEENNAAERMAKREFVGRMKEYCSSVSPIVRVHE